MIAHRQEVPGSTHHEVYDRADTGQVLARHLNQHSAALLRLEVSPNPTGTVRFTPTT